MRERLNAKLRQVKANPYRMRHLTIPEQGHSLRLLLSGFYNYYAVPTNFRALNTLFYHVLCHWLRCLQRLSQRHKLTWRKMMRIAGAASNRRSYRDAAFSMTYKPHDFTWMLTGEA
jgi:RNA-directed DNA polymerase